MGDGYPKKVLLNFLDALIFNTVPYVMVTSNRKIILLLLPN